MRINEKRRYFWFGIVLLFGGAAYWFYYHTPPVAPRFETTAVTRGDVVISIAATGQLSAQQEVTVSSQISGIITKVLVDFNSPVKKGDLMAVVDPQQLEAQLATARAALVKAQAQYNEATFQLREGRLLHERSYISDTDLRTLELAVETSKAQLESAQADFKKNNISREYTQIRAPIDGVVLVRSVEPGNTVAASLQAPTLFVVASDLKKMKILASVDESQIAAIKVGMQAQFTVSGIEGRIFAAQVKQVRLQSTVVQNVVTYTVVLDADNPTGELYPGMTATIDFIVQRITDQLLVPSSALRVRVPKELQVAPQRGNKHKPTPSAAAQNSVSARPVTVWLLNDQGQAYRVPVRVLGSDLSMTAIEVSDGQLKVGDAVITRIVNAATTANARAVNQGRNMMGGYRGGH